ncbi:MAG: hypothetical protein PVF58_07295 [Candidatus Methanofastidiosia archaeon]|jgi:hypothetical protein
MKVKLSKCGIDCGDHDIEEAITFILSKKTSNNTWVVDKVPSSMYGSWGKKGKESTA